MSDAPRPFRCLLVDDEPLAHELLQQHIARVPDLIVTGRAFTAHQAAEVLRAESIDLLFLDINMPGLSGLELLRSLPRPPLTIMTTANAAHALEGFDLDVVDYLLKPITFDRFHKAVQKALDRLGRAVNAAPSDEPRSMLVRVDHAEVRVEFDQVLYVEAIEKYVRIHLPGRKLVTLLSLGRMEAILPKPMFERIHKSYIINLRKVEAIVGNEVRLQGGGTVPVSREAKARLRERLGRGQGA